MITILSGCPAAVRAALAAHVCAGPRVRVRAAPGRAVPWGGARRLTAALRALRGDAALEAAFAPELDVLGLILRDAIPAPPAARRLAESPLVADELGMLGHNGALQAPLFDAWQRALEPLVAGVTLEVPDLLALDPESVSLLTRLATSGAPAEVVLAADPGAAAAHPLWGHEVRFASGHLAMLEALPDTRILSLEPATNEPPADEPAAWDPWDDRAELAAAAGLDAESPSDEALDAAVAAARASFAVFGFSAALRLGLAVLERGYPRDLVERGRLHTLVALAAYNRQVRSQGNGELAAFIGRHLAAALEVEPDPARRAHLLYRVCINRSRRLGDLEGGLRAGDRAVEVARDRVADPALSAFFEAWARNGRAYVLARLRRGAEAAADVARARELLDGVVDGLRPTLANEVAYSRLVVTNNVAEVLYRQRRWAEAEIAQAELEDAERAFFGGPPRMAARRWIALLAAQQRLQAAAVQAERAAAEALEVMDAFAADDHLASLGDLRYRCGDAAGARAAFEQALAIRRRVALPEDVLQTELGAALAADRAGDHAAARAAFEAALAGPIAGDLAAEAEVLAALGVSAARAGDGDGADAAVNDAIDRAIQSGARGALLRVALAAGEACLALGRTTAAADAFERAGTLAAGADDRPSAAPPERLLALVGQLRAGSDGPERVTDALALLPAALADPEVWWVLPALAAGVGRHRAALVARLEGDLAAAVEVLERALGERVDAV